MIGVDVVAHQQRANVTHGEAPRVCRHRLGKAFSVNDNAVEMLDFILCSYRLMVGIRAWRMLLNRELRISSNVISRWVRKRKGESDVLTLQLPCFLRK
jgi:hypothetical protein